MMFFLCTWHCHCTRESTTHESARSTMDLKH